MRTLGLTRNTAALAANERINGWTAAVRVAVLALVGVLLAGAVAAQDPYMRHELDELTLRQGDKPWVRLFDDGAFPTERTIFKDTVTGAELWRMTDSPRLDRHDYYDIPAWNSVGSHMLLTRASEVMHPKTWLLPADGSWIRPAATLTLEMLESGSGVENAARGVAYWSWRDPSQLINLFHSRISLIDPITMQHTEVFDLMTSPVVHTPGLPVLEEEDFSLVPPHPGDDRLLIGTGKHGRLFSFDMNSLELVEVPNDGQWEVPEEHLGVVAIHRLRWTKNPNEPTLFIGQDAYFHNGNPIEDSRQFTSTLDGTLTDWVLPYDPDRRGGHPDLTMGGDAITGTYLAGIWRLNFDGSPNWIIYDAKMEQHHASCTWDDRWLTADNGTYVGGPPTILRGFDVEHGIVLASLDGRAANVLNYHYSSYAIDESTHPAPTSSPDATKIAYDSDMLDRATGNGGDGDGNADLWTVVVRPPSPPRSLTARARPSYIQVNWKSSFHAPEAVYWNPGNQAREIAGYNVFRGLETGGPYEQINDGPILAETYRDTTFEPGVRYYYVVQAVEHSGLASLYSQEISVSTLTRRWQGDVMHYYEAEHGELTLPMVAQFEPAGASGSWFVGTFAAEPDPSFPVETGPADVAFTVKAPLGGRYSLWARVKGFDFGGSFDVEVEGIQQSVSFAVTPGDWTWVELPKTVRMRGGFRTVRLITEDAEIGVDRLALALGVAGPPPEFGNGDTLAPLPPSDPRVVALDGQTKKIVWAPSPDRDVRYYNVYCGRDPNYDLGNRNLLKSPSNPMIVDWGIPAGLDTVYKITAVDRFGNESDAIVFDPAVEGEESAPEAVDDYYESPEDQVLDVSAPGVLGNDIDEDGDELTATLLVGTEHGQLVLNQDGSFTYTPDFEFSGEDGFTYTASDGVTTSRAATVTISIADNSDAPVANDDFYELDEDQYFSSGPPAAVLVNDTDAEGDELTAVLEDNARHGELTLGANGIVHYTPDDDWNGVDTFTYRATDGVNYSNIATATLTVHPVEDVPVAYNDTYETDEDVVLDVPADGVLANDFDADEDPLSAILDSNPSKGDVFLRLDGGFVYSPNPHVYGLDTFTYHATDGKGSSGVREVRIVINSVNDVPVALGDSYVTDEDVTLEVLAPGVVGNDTDADGDRLEPDLVSDVSHGSLVVRSSGSILYNPDDNYNGTDQFTYRAVDRVSSSNLVTVTITVRPVNDAPDTTNDLYSTIKDTPLVVNAGAGVLANDTDPEGDPMEASRVSGPTNGSVTLNSNGSFVYTPNPGFRGADRFYYVADDGDDQSGTTEVKVSVLRP